MVWIDMVVGIISADECQTLETGAEAYRGYTSSDSVSYTHLRISVPYIKGDVRMEIWKDIKGQEGRYQISSTGRLRRMPRYVKGKSGSLRRLPMQTLELTYDEVKKIKRKLEEGEHVLKIAEEFNISRKVVSKIKSGRSYAWVER